MNQAKLQSAALLVGRVGLGLVILYYGCQKALGIFGGAGIQGTIDFMAAKNHITVPFAVLNIIAEFLGSLGLIIGFLTRLAAFGIFCSMAVAVWVMSKDAHFFSALMAGEVKTVNTVMYPLINGVTAFTFVLAGAGDYSLDKKMFGKRGK